ncbi:serine/arginine repetitive matrix protein 1-like [Sorghum bicolor]|uniref:serine/arginine repetitive matrix protein 1-like n=1 Tax=Sorghum bicolor TaxID=4558 RepID=UPI000B425F47|nr:serine/arginine repetitive matrix protein 1-like [Sorghum bicolor]|eukprot:XP_021315090.1 serine/arginine repetitive matrix protein 1-like [Sorghum bicolor]
MAAAALCSVPSAATLPFSLARQRRRVRALDLVAPKALCALALEAADATSPSSNNVGRDPNGAPRRAPCFSPRAPSSASSLLHRAGAAAPRRGHDVAPASSSPRRAPTPQRRPRTGAARRVELLCATSPSRPPRRRAPRRRSHPRPRRLGPAPLRRALSPQPPSATCDAEPPQQLQPRQALLQAVSRLRAHDGVEP